jgi:hypothetical protein
MTASRDPDRKIRAFLFEGADQLQDQVYDAIRAGVDQRRQRVFIGPWRMPTLNKLIPISVGAAAAIGLLFLGSRFLGSPAPNVGAPTASPVTTASPTPPASTKPSSSVSAGLPQGSFALWRGASGAGQGVSMTVTIAAPGWYGDPGNGILMKHETADPPDGAGLIVFPDGAGWYVPRDPCKWNTTFPDAASTTVDGLITALAAQASRDASAPKAVSVDGHAGKSITLHVPDDANFSTCDGGKFCTLGNPEQSPSDSCYRYHQGPGQTDTLRVVQVNGMLVVIDSAVYAGTPPADAAELDAIVSSTTFK